MEWRKFLPMAGTALALCIAGSVGGVSNSDQVKIVQAADAAEETLAVEMSQPSGIYENAFALQMSCEGASAIYYTTDGSDPTTSETRTAYSTELSIVDRKGADNYVSAVSPDLFDTANASWSRSKKAYSSTAKVPSNDAVDKGTVVKAVAMDAAGNYGAVTTNTYFVGTVADHIKGAKESAAAAGIDLSVMSISVDYADLFDYEKGIYVKGKIFDDAVQKYIDDGGSTNSRTMNDKARSFPANYSQKGRDWERNAHIDYFETDGTTMECKLQQDCGIRIQGNYSRSDLMKGLRLYARADYGKKNFKYAFFPNAKDDTGEVIAKYKKIVLRNGGNYAFSGTKYNDAYWQSMLTELDCETQASRACVVYIDGEYWGLYVLQQDYDDNYFEVTHGVNKDDVVVYKASDADADEAYKYKLDEGNLPEGEKADYFYKDLIEFFKTHNNLRSQEDYDAFIKLVDPQSVKDYFAVQVWINNKWDWPGKNWSMWKTTSVEENSTYGDGRWRFIFGDLDFGGCAGWDDVYANTIFDDNYNTTVDEDENYGNEKGLLGQNLKEAFNPGLQCFILLMTNDRFRSEYLQELENLQNTCFEATKAVSALDYLAGMYNPLFAQFIDRYNYNIDYTYGYAGYNNLKTFVQNRKNGIDTIVSGVENYYSSLNYDKEPYYPYTTVDKERESSGNEEPDPTPTPTPGTNSTPTPGTTAAPTPGTSNTPAPGQSAVPSQQPTVAPTPGTTAKPAPTKAPAKKKIKKLTVSAKRGKKTITVKTLGKAKVTVTVSKKIIVKGKKKVKKVTFQTSKKGVRKIKLSKKLTKGTKIKVTVKKAGYTTRTKVYKVK